MWAHESPKDRNGSKADDTIPPQSARSGRLRVAPCSNYVDERSWMARKRLNHAAETFCAMFCGWRLSLRVFRRFVAFIGALNAWPAHTARECQRQLFAIGKLTVAARPPSRSDVSSFSVAPCRSAIALMMARPSPLPAASLPATR